MIKVTTRRTINISNHNQMYGGIQFPQTSVQNIVDDYKDAIAWQTHPSDGTLTIYVSDPDPKVQVNLVIAEYPRGEWIKVEKV